MPRDRAAPLASADYAVFYLLDQLPQRWEGGHVRLETGEQVWLDAKVVRAAVRGRGVCPVRSSQALSLLLDFTTAPGERERFVGLAAAETGRWNEAVADYAAHAGEPRLVTRRYAELLVADAALRAGVYDVTFPLAAQHSWLAFEGWLCRALAHTRRPPAEALGALRRRFGERGKRTQLDRWLRASAHPSLPSLRELTEDLLALGYPETRCVRGAPVAPELMVGASLARWAAAPASAAFVQLFDELHWRTLQHARLLEDISRFGAPKQALWLDIMARGTWHPAGYAIAQALAADPTMSTSTREVCAGLLTFCRKDYLLERVYGATHVAWSAALTQVDELITRAACESDAERRQTWMRALALCEQELRDGAPCWLTYAFAHALRAELGLPPRKEWRHQVRRMRGVDIAEPSLRAWLLRCPLAAPASQPRHDGGTALGARTAAR